VGRGGENLEQALGDKPELDAAMAGRDLSADEATRITGWYILK